MFDLAAQLAPEWWLVIGFAATVAALILYSVIEGHIPLGKKYLDKVPAGYLFSIVMIPFLLGFALTVTSDNIRIDRLDDAVVTAVEDKYDVEVGRHKEFTQYGSTVTPEAWVIDGTATNCLFEITHHWSAGRPVIDSAYAVCDGRELPIAS